MRTAEKVRITERNVSLGLQGRRDLEDLNALGHTTRPVTNLLNIPDSWGGRQKALAGEYGRPRHNGNTLSHDVNPVPLNLLLKHMEVHYTECQLRHDLDCVLPLCGTEADRQEVREFASRKLADRPYQGHGVTVLGKVCESCRNPFTAKRESARFCSPKCRVRAARRAA
jgi:hypothetical protein